MVGKWQRKERTAACRRTCQWQSSGWSTEFRQLSCRLSDSIPMFSWLGGRSRRSACTQVHWETKSMYLFACCGPGATHVRQLLQITLHQPADTICKVCQQIALHPTCGHNCYNLRETDPCDHSATHVADQVRHTCDPCATTMRHPLVPFSIC